VSFIISFLLGGLGIFAFIFYVVFAQKDRRDKIYSSLFGWFVSMAIWMLLWKFTDVKSMLPPEALP
jgi:uncharacterized membrane-anchored protein